MSKDFTVHPDLLRAQSANVQKGIENAYSNPCYCIGPQNGEPLCPCAMRSVTVKDGRYVQVIDHGPALTPEQIERNRETREMMNEMMKRMQSLSVSKWYEGAPNAIIARNCACCCDQPTVPPDCPACKGKGGFPTPYAAVVSVR